MPATPTLPGAARAGLASPLDDAHLLRAGLAAVALSVVANAVVRAVVVDGLGIGRSFPPLSWGNVLGLTVVGAVLATLVFAWFARTHRPARQFVQVSVAALVLSFIPDVALLANPGATPNPAEVTLTNVGVLMVMHVVAAVAIVGALLRVSAGPHTERRAARGEGD